MQYFKFGLVDKCSDILTLTSIDFNDQLIHGFQNFLFVNLLVKEPWLVNALVDTFIVSHSQRCLEVLGSIQEPQDKV